MLRTGVILWFSSTVTVALRYADVPIFMNPLIRLFCIAGLMLSVVCFITVYVLSEYSNRKRWQTSTEVKPQNLQMAHSVAH